MIKSGYYQYKVELQSGYLADGSVWGGWVYEIYSLGPNPKLICESKEWFDSEMRAGLAAIGHITLLENGEG